MTSNRIISLATAFMFGLVMVALLSIWFAVAHSQSADQSQIIIIVGFHGKLVEGAQVLGFTPSLEECKRSIQEAMPELHPKADIKVVGLCTPLPPAP